MKQKPISDLEQEVMDVVWELGKCTIRQVADRMATKKEFAYTTIATLLSRLHEKGLLGRNVTESVVKFSPKITKQDYGKRVANSFLGRFFDTFGDMAVASFAQSIDELPKAKREKILHQLSSYDKKD